MKTFLYVKECSHCLDYSDKKGGGGGESGVGIIWAIGIDIYTIDTMYKIGN